MTRSDSASRPRIVPFELLMLALFVLFLAVPLVVTNPYYLHVFILIFFFGYLGTAWSLIGMAGSLSFGHAAIVGVGGYISTLLFMHLGITPWLGMVIAATACAALGVAISFPAFRLRGPYFALTSIAFAEIIRIYVENTEVGPFGIPLKASMGLLLPFKGNAPALFQFENKQPFYYIALLMMAGIVAVSYVINRRRMGYYLAAIRGDQDAAESLCINCFKYRVAAMAISCFFTAAGGTFYAQYFLFINPDRAMSLGLSIEIALVGVVGGWQTVFGPMIGSILLSPTGELVRGYFGGNYAGLHLVLYGALLMVVVLALPNGIYGPLAARINRVGRRVVERRPDSLKGDAR